MTRIRIIIGLGSLVMFGLILGTKLLAAPPSLSSSDALSFAGFNEIDVRKTCFLVVGDTQRTSHWEFWRERNEKERRLIAAEVSRREPAFVLHLGDLTTRGSSEEEWQEFDTLYHAVREKRVPCFPLLGNHEYYGNNRKALENYFERFPHLEERLWYSFIWKNTAVIMVNSIFSSLSEEERQQQVNWYRDELEKFEKDPNIDHVMVCSHAPPFTNSRVVGPSNEVKTLFADPFIQASKTRIFLSGHAHTYERFRVANKHFIVSGGGGGPRHKVQTDSRKRLFNDLFEGPELRFFHFCEIESRDRYLIFRVIRLQSDGTFSLADSIPVGSAD
jgi:hypothetical protein